MYPDQLQNMKKLIPFFLFLFIYQFVFAQLTIRLTEVPANTPMEDNIHIAGDFQGWEPGADEYILENNGDGTYEIELDLPDGQILFKFTRGSWPMVEGDENGGEIGNRVYNFAGGTDQIELEVLSWKDLAGGGGGSGTAAENVHILDNDFYIPQLDRNRRIWIYLPPDYETSSKHYPVMYMHDGQNLFDVQTSFSGEWEVDESLNQLFADGDYGCIVIGIENGGALRIDELSPWYNSDYDAGGEGGQYVDFIVETLKPYVDSNYRTLPGREFTVLFGSSLGGLISQYGIIEHQDVIGKAGVFSPAFWFNNPEVYDHSANTEKMGDLKIYMLAGYPEGSGSVVEDVNQMESVLFDNGFENWEFNKAFHADGQHAEWYWAREFPWAYLWLFDGLEISSASEAESTRIKVYPNPADSIVKFENLPELKRPVLRIYDLSGKLLKKEKITDDSIDVSDLEPGVYVLDLRAKHRFNFTQKLMIK